MSKAELRKNIDLTARTLSRIERIPAKQRTDEDESLLRDAEEFLYKKGMEFFYSEVDDIMSHVRLRIEGTNTDHMALTLTNDATKPPKLPHVMTDGDFYNLSRHLYGAIVTISGTLERLRPELDILREYETRIKCLYSLIAMVEKDWQMKTYYHVIVETDFHNYLLRVDELTSAYTHRLDALKRSQDIISRMQTLHQAIPADVRPVADTSGGRNFSTSPEALVAKTPGRFGINS